MRKEKFYINSFFWMSFGAILSVKIVWLLAFWPGIATYDTLNQWNQAITGQYNNAHPFFYTFLLQISRYLTNSIWVVAVGQIVAFSFLGAWILYRGKKESLNNFLIYGGLIFYTFWPEFSIFSVTIWKDIFYSISALWISTLIYFSIKEGNFRKYQYPIIMASALPALFRHNGVIFCFSRIFC
jgi:hypothetical protein